MYPTTVGIGPFYAVVVTVSGELYIKKDVPYLTEQEAFDAAIKTSERLQYVIKDELKKSGYS